jgi:hypothetical protein
MARSPIARRAICRSAPGAPCAGTSSPTESHQSRRGKVIAFRAQPIRRVRKPLAVAYCTAELPELVRQIRDFHVLRSVSVGAWVSIPDADHFRALKALRHRAARCYGWLMTLLRLRHSLMSGSAGRSVQTALPLRPHTVCGWEIADRKGGGCRASPPSCPTQTAHSGAI